MPMQILPPPMKSLTARLAAGILALTIAGHAEEFTLIDLGTLGGTQSFALDVNNNRQVSGNSLVTSDPGSTGSLLRAYLWTSGTMTNLGSMAPIPPSTSTNRFARGYAVNDAGVAVGEFNNDSSRSFVFIGGVMSGLTRLAGDNDNGVAHDINNAGVIVGISSNGTASKPTMWTYDGSNYVASNLGTIIGTPTSSGRAWAINEQGVAVGLSSNGSTSQATMWKSGTIINLTSLGSGVNFSQAYSINDHLQVVGASSTGETVGDLTGTTSTTSLTRAFLWQEGTMTELPPFNLYTPENNGATTNYHSEAKDINEAGLVVGNSSRISGSPAVATLWENGLPIDLNTFLPAGSGWVLLSAEGINENGDIVGYGTFNGSSRAYLLENAVPPAQPDVSVTLGSRQNVGIGMFSPTPQMLSAREKRSRFEVLFGITNAGGEGVFSATAGGSRVPGTQVTFMQNGSNVTAGLIAGTWRSSVLPSDESTTISASVTVTPRHASRLLAMDLKAVSLRDDSLEDSAGASVTLAATKREKPKKPKKPAKANQPTKPEQPGSPRGPIASTSQPKPVNSSRFR